MLEAVTQRAVARRASKARVRDGGATDDLAVLDVLACDVVLGKLINQLAGEDVGEERVD